MFHTTNCRSVAEHGTSLAQRGLEEAAAWIPYAVCYAKKKTNKAPKDGQFLKQSWLFPFRNVGAVSNIPAPYVQADIPVSLGVCSLTSCTVSGAFFFSFSSTDVSDFILVQAQDRKRLHWFRQFCPFEMQTAERKTEFRLFHGCSVLTWGVSTSDFWAEQRGSVSSCQPSRQEAV